MHSSREILGHCGVLLIDRADLVIRLDMCGYTLHCIRLHPRERIFFLHKLYSSSCILRLWHLPCRSIVLPRCVAIFVLTQVPPYILPLLCLSKRLHSIYILRLFNDCWTQLFLLLACWLFVNRQWTVGGIAYSLALGIKLNAILYFPGIMVIIMMATGLERAIRTVVLIIQVQVIQLLTT